MSMASPLSDAGDSPSAATGQAPLERDTLRLLLSTDNHLGYAEKDPVRGEDSFRSFQEVLRIARDERVDLLLLGGDLFHENKPSRKTLYQTMSLLRQHCMGDGAVRFQIVSDQSLNFPNFGTVNYEDPNYNIELPVFSIHGNHDDPAREAGGTGGGGGTQALAALDLLSAANFVNYFGRSERVDAVEVFPILMLKGDTRVAIYGLGNMRDERLHRMFAQQKVIFRRPAEHPEQWFSIFVVHQNRDDKGRGAKNCLPESFIPDFIDFVVWGHEHECLIDVQESLKGEFFVSQPGSSVATSLVEGEAREKRVAVLEVNGQSFRMTTRPLTTVRAFKMTEVVLSEVEELDPDDPDVAERIREYLEARVRELLDEAAVERIHREKQQDTETPEELRQILVRVRVEHTGFPVLVNQRFGGKFVGKVANPNDILLFYRRKRERVAALDKKAEIAVMKDALRMPVRPARLDTVTVEDILSKHFNLPDRKLVFFPEGQLADALEKYVDKNMPSALEEFVETVLDETQQDLAKRVDTKSKQDIASVVGKKIEKLDAERLLREEEAEEASEMQTDALATEPSQASKRSAKPSRTVNRLQVGSEDDDDDIAEKPKPQARSSRFGAPRSHVAPPTASTSRSRASSVSDGGDSDFMDELMDEKTESSRPAANRTKSKPEKAPTQLSRKRKAPSPDVSPSPPPARRAAVSAAKRAKTSASDFLSDDDDSLGPSRRHSFEESDGDEDYEQEDGEEESEMTESLLRNRRQITGRAKAKKSSAPPRGRKRLRRDASMSDDSDGTAALFGETRNETSSVASSSSRASRGRKQHHVSNNFDLMSSESDDHSTAPPPRRRATTPGKKAPTSRAKPQPKINEMFQQQARRAKITAEMDDEIESDPEFTEFTDASAVPATQQPSGRFHHAAAGQSESQSQQSQSQSQAFGLAGGGAKRRKLPLSMTVSSQTSRGGGNAAPAASARKSWGRTRR